MFTYTRSSSRRQWSIGLWALLLSVTAATLAAVLGIHTLGDSASLSDTQAASSIAQSLSTDIPPQAPETALSANNEAMTGLSDTGGVLACTALALLCAVILATFLVRARSTVARGLDPLASPGPVVPPADALTRSGVVSLTVLGIARI